MKPGLPQDLTALVDAHAHYHDCFDLIIFLDGALANFQRAAQLLGLTKSCVGCLLLALFGAAKLKKNKILKKF